MENSENLYKIFPKGTDAQVADAVLELFRKRDNIDLFNNLGIHVKTLYVGWVEKGFNSIKINNLDQKTGFYIVKLQFKDQAYWHPIVIE